jgi:hypothetical protein
MWKPIDKDAPTDKPHFRALWVHSPLTGKPTHWVVEYGTHDVESNYFLSAYGDEHPWTAVDYTHWMECPEPPPHPGTEVAPKEPDAKPSAKVLKLVKKGKTDE